MNLSESLREIAEYYGKDVQLVEAQYNNVAQKYPGYVKWSNLSANEWDKMNVDEKDIQSVMEFYKTTPNYIFELMEYHSTESKQKLSNTVIEISKRYNVHSILDFGAGICQDSILAAKNSFNSTAADIPGKTFDFGKWRIKKYQPHISTLDIIDDSPLTENYDAITCFEVLQHVVNPEKTLLHLKHHLTNDGRLFITTRFRNNYSLALKHNESLEDTFEELIEKCELNVNEKLHMWGEKEKSKFLYVLSTRN